MELDPEPGSGNFRYKPKTFRDLQSYQLMRDAFELRWYRSFRFRPEYADLRPDSKVAVHKSGIVLPGASVRDVETAERDLPVEYCHLYWRLKYRIIAYEHAADRVRSGTVLGCNVDPSQHRSDSVFGHDVDRS